MRTKGKDSDLRPITKAMAVKIARKWVRELSSTQPQLVGSLLHGSILDLEPSSPLGTHSDVDLLLVVSDSSNEWPSGKIEVEGMTLEPTAVPIEEVADPEAVLASIHLSRSFATGEILTDPQGALAPICEKVGSVFSEPAWRWKRVRAVEDKCRNMLGDSETGPDLWSRQQSVWFGWGQLSHRVLVLALVNPTVRTRWIASRKVHEELGDLDTHESLLEAGGVAGLTPLQAEESLRDLDLAFQDAISCKRTPYERSSDVSPFGREIAVSGGRDLIARGLHREGFFWTLVSWIRCIKALRNDAEPDVLDRHEFGFARAARLAGIESDKGIASRRAMIEEALVAPVFGARTPLPIPGEGLEKPS